MTRKQEIEDEGAALLAEHGLSGWRVVAVSEEDDLGDEDDIAGSRGRCLHDERVIWINLRYEDDARNILLHEIAHALCPNDYGHGAEWAETARRIGYAPETRNT